MRRWYVMPCCCCYWECIISVLVVACVFFFFFLFFMLVSQWVYQNVHFFTFKHNFPDTIVCSYTLMCLMRLRVAAERIKSFFVSWVLNVIFVSFVVHIRIPPNGNKCSALFSVWFFLSYHSKLCIAFNCVKYFNCEEEKNDNSRDVSTRGSKKKCYKHRSGFLH